MNAPAILKSVLAAVLIAFSTLTFAEPLNINTASADQFTTLRGIGPKKAEAIVRYRTDNGSFASIEDLLNVKGIGPSTLEKNRERLAITALTPAVETPQ